MNNKEYAGRAAEAAARAKANRIQKPIMTKSTQLLQLAVMFRTNDPNLGHVSTFDSMTDAGLAYTYGLFRAIPKHHRRKRSAMAESIASQLERKAQSN